MTTQKQPATPLHGLKAQGYNRAVADYAPLVEAARDVHDAVAEHIMRMDKLMKGPSTRERGQAIAESVTRVQRKWEGLRAALAALDGKQAPDA